MYPTSHKWLGMADNIRRDNLLAFHGYNKMKVTSWFNWSVDYFYFMAADKEKGEGALINGTGDDGALAQEVDLQLNFKVVKNVSLNLGGSWFIAAKENETKDKPFFFYGQLTARF